jgi:hypothetical protein
MLIQPLISKNGSLQLLALLCLLSILLAACNSSANVPPTPTTSSNSTVATNNGTITYKTGPADVLIRTFYGGGNTANLAFSPEISIYGDGTYILGPGLQMHQGRLSTDTLQQLLHTLVNTDGLLNFSRQQFYDVPDQNANLLELALNNKHFEFVYGKFGTLQESSHDMDEYHRLDHALTTITETLKGQTSLYSNRSMTILVHQDFSPDLTQTIPIWSLKDLSLGQLATFECGIIPPDETGPNADTGCLTFTIPHYAFLPTAQQLTAINMQLRGQPQGEFIEQGLYYRVVVRPLLPDELLQSTVAMFGSQELTYVGVPLHRGPVPTPVVRP